MQQSGGKTTKKDVVSCEDETTFNDELFVQYAMDNYNNPSCLDHAEFEEDLNRIKYIKRLFGRYHSSGELKERLILNHLIVFYNVFDMDAATRMLFYRMEDRFRPLLKTFLVYLNFLPKDETYTRIPMDTKVIEILRRI